MVLVDTTIWSPALRRRRTSLSSPEEELVTEWARLVRAGEAGLAGPIRLEVLSGIRSEQVFGALQQLLGDFRYFEILPRDYDRAASFFNRCRASGVAGTAIDMLLCAIARRCRVPIFTTDQNFFHYAQHLDLTLYQPA